jgi:hypothetical protein
MVGEYICPSNIDKKKQTYRPLANISSTTSHPFCYRTANPVAARKKTATMSCPCGLKKHPWDPEDCGVLEFAIRGSTDRNIKHLAIKKQNDILNEVWKEKWEKLG